MKNINETVNQLNDVIEKLLLDTIRYEHPNWVEQNGECSRCIEYYESLSDIFTYDI